MLLFASNLFFGLMTFLLRCWNYYVYLLSLLVFLHIDALACAADRYERASRENENEEACRATRHIRTPRRDHQVN